MDKEYLSEKLANMRTKYIDSVVAHDIVHEMDERLLSRKMEKIKKKLVTLEMERCQKVIEHRDVSKIDQKISQQKALFEECVKINK